MTEFLTNFENRFRSSIWIEAVDFSKFHISGGCIVNSLCEQPFADTAIQQVDINFNGDSFNEFDENVATVFDNLTRILLKKNRHLHATLIKKEHGSYDVLLSIDIQLKFNFKNVSDKADPISYVLHSSDIDVSQVSFTGSSVVCTFAFLQAIATHSFMCYTMHEEMDKSVCQRITRYCQRGFVFLQPQDFNNVIYIDMMARNALEEITEDIEEIMDDDANDDNGSQTIVVAYHSCVWPFPNVDTYRLQEMFIKRICSQKLD